MDQVHEQLVKKREALHSLLIQVDLMYTLRCMEITCLFKLDYEIQQFYVLLTQCIYEFCMDIRIISNYFPNVHCAVRTVPLYVHSAQSPSSNQ